MATIPFFPPKRFVQQSAAGGNSKEQKPFNVSWIGRKLAFLFQERKLAILNDIEGTFESAYQSPGPVPTASSINSAVSTSLMEDLPMELIAAIFSWIAPAHVHKYRALCHSINNILSDSYFHNLNVTNFYRKLEPLEKVVKISYVVFPDLETVKSSWEILLHDYRSKIYGDKPFISIRSKDHGILLVASNMIKHLGLPFPLEHVNARRIMRYNRATGNIRRLNDRDMNQRGPFPFDPVMDVLVFWNPALPSIPVEPPPPQPQTLRIFVPAYTSASRYERLQNEAGKSPNSKRINVPFSLYPCLSHTWSVWKDGYPMKDGRVDSRWFMLLLEDFMQEHGLVNAIVRRQPFSGGIALASPTTIYDCNDGNDPLDFRKEKIVIYPMGLHNVVVPPSTLELWNATHQQATAAAAERDFGKAVQLFRELIKSKLDVYGIKGPPAYENHVDIASIRIAQQDFKEASKELCIFFENGPQRSEAVLMTAFELLRQIAMKGDCPGLVGPYTAERFEGGDGGGALLADSYSDLSDVYFQTGLFSGNIAVPINRDKVDSIECVDSFDISGRFLHSQGRYREALKRFRTALNRRQLLFPNQLDALQSTRDHMQTARLELCKELMAKDDYHAAYPLSKSYYNICMEDFGSFSKKAIEASNMVKQCEDKLCSI